MSSLRHEVEIVRREAENVEAMRIQMPAVAQELSDSIEVLLRKCG